MPLYTYRCTSCGEERDYFWPIDDDGERAEFEAEAEHEACGARVKRVFSFSSPADPIGDGYYDNSVGAWITSKRALDDHNKAASEAHTARTGVETNFVAHDIRDAAPRLKPEGD